MVIDSPLPFRSEKTRCVALMRRKKVMRNIWSDEKVLGIFFQKLRPKEVLTCSMKEQNVLSIEDQLRLAYQWKVTAISLVHMRDDCVCPFIGAYYSTFKEFFPGCPIATPEITSGSFKSVPNLLSRSPTQHSSCTDNLECGNLRRLGSAPIEVPMKASRHITQLTVDNCCVSDAALEQILNVMHTVTNLSIVSCNCLSDMALWSCLRPWMTHITVRDCLNFKDDALQAIVQSTPSLQELNIQIYHLSDIAMGTFMSRRHFNLRVLRVVYASDLTLLGVANLVGSLPGLQELRLTGCSRINDAAVDLICEHMRYLQVLEISANPIITDAALATIGESLEQLEQLSLDRCKEITNDGVRALGTLLNLQILTVRWCSALTNECLPHLVTLNRLRFLSLAGCKALTIEGLLNLAFMKNLQKLEITNTGNVHQSKSQPNRLYTRFVFVCADTAPIYVFNTLTREQQPMFVVVPITDVVVIKPKKFGADIGEWIIPISFRLICFRPSIDEVIIGAVKNCTPDGLHISLYFFDDIFVPADKLRHPSKFDYEQQCWIWQYEDDGESADLRIERNDTIRFRVEQEIWQDPNPNGEKQDQNQATFPFGNKSPYVIVGSIVSDGLGLTCWWIN
ncbi:F-box/LRR-repeat protein 16 [Taenia crassiceps]|uniref:F-box/LRR-repeat protein 16 n=1 Tax=Taenia crassiceps TaxID=6207 RepID=A0ABR4Q196_9CEST